MISLFDHIVLLHKLESNFPCIFRECNRVYSRFRSFEAHVIQKHGPLKPSLKKTSVLSKDTCVHDEQTPLLDSTVSVTEKTFVDVSLIESDDESIIYEENVFERPNDMCLIDKPPYEYISIINDAWLNFTASLYTKTNIPRKHVDFIIQKTNTLLSTILGTVKKKVCSSIKNINDEELDNLNVFFLIFLRARRILILNKSALLNMKH